MSFESLGEARRTIEEAQAAIERGEDVQANQRVIRDAIEWTQDALEDGTIEVLETGRIQ